MSRQPVPFASRIDRSAGLDACWPFMGCRVRGYGQITRDGHKVYAHRVALENALGRALGPGKLALHHCDNPPCCNPRHLYEGTPANNSQDMHDRGRAPQHLGCERPDVTLRWITAMRERGAQPATERTDDIAGWREEAALDAAADLGAFIERLTHGDRLPDWIA